ncbi:UNVERIFIED_CONTAM: hypothetical protein Sangu_2910200 [Sesamum angustifolium]|uniref:DUF4283 domain-containing protein n=1 Tax=Sesamum angustifolium TaxID=2727405 RepID=A0AAW2INE8_9LAMI
MELKAVMTTCRRIRRVICKWSMMMAELRIPLRLLRVRQMIYYHIYKKDFNFKEFGAVVVRPSLDMVRNGSRRWLHTAVGYFLGRRPYFHHLKREDRGSFKVNRLSYKPRMALKKHTHIDVPVWAQLKHLPVEFWIDEGLSAVACGIGKPLYQEPITKACMRLDFARVCVMLNISSTLSKHIVIMVPNEDGTEVPCKVDIQYEWIPLKCIKCTCLGHSTASCKPSNASIKIPVNVYV